MRLDDVIYWLKGKTGLDSDEENDQRSIECGLIRCMSELKNKELDSVKLSEDFQHRFLMELDKTEQEYQEERKKKKFSSILN
ncbi:MAG: hypothetical protein KDK36_01515, partial [Leptospiraceae bacterium]|nr:hypothetical protein [Leptospiraceae bacterium]